MAARRAGDPGCRSRLGCFCGQTDGVGYASLCITEFDAVHLLRSPGSVASPCVQPPRPLHKRRLSSDDAIAPCLLDHSCLAARCERVWRSMDPPVRGDHSAERYKADLEKCRTTSSERTAQKRRHSGDHIAVQGPPAVRAAIRTCMAGKGYTLAQTKGRLSCRAEESASGSSAQAPPTASCSGRRQGGQSPRTFARRDCSSSYGVEDPPSPCRSGYRASARSSDRRCSRSSVSFSR